MFDQFIEITVNGTPRLIRFSAIRGVVSTPDNCCIIILGDDPKEEIKVNDTYNYISAELLSVNRTQKASRNMLESLTDLIYAANNYIKRRDD